MTVSSRTYFFSFLPLIFLFSNSQLNENIINEFLYLIVNTGYIIIFYLLIILTVPIVDKTQKLIDRSALGISTFIYSVSHFLLYIVDNDIMMAILLEDFLNLTYIQIGYIAFILFIPLALTSNPLSKKVLNISWYNLHKIVYIIIVASLIHYYLIIKADYLIFYIYVFLFLSVVFLKYILSLKMDRKR